MGLLLWLFFELDPSVTARRVVIALAVTVLLGYLSYALDTASLSGMFTGVPPLLFTVFGGFGWFAVLMSFFASVASRRSTATTRNSTAASPRRTTAHAGAGTCSRTPSSRCSPSSRRRRVQPYRRRPAPFFYAFAGAVAAAMTDTFSIEFGGLYDNPRLITTLRPVEPGTDGGVTWQGVAAGAAGAAIVAGIAALTPDISQSARRHPPRRTRGMTVDSFLGATVEGARIGNEAVNFSATLAAALTGAGVVLTAGLL